MGQKDIEIVNIIPTNEYVGAEFGVNHHQYSIVVKQVRQTSQQNAILEAVKEICVEPERCRLTQFMYLVSMMVIYNLTFVAVFQRQC